ncbi:IclR family transcriptional regulator [Galactobacter caseinivorans]|uniref:ArsR family transcriptional regulator n=1 Tax=Galactobacter caseinivorans TaxID=2676123 RepID=A0A496PJ17_9MICC|nr:helix-turn-helix domain-containing protein [Galactobacter caseinivorans]RKW70410.1 ArsR family transcriptional regulator [Galactobacter caseinivorans]
MPDAAPSAGSQTLSRGLRVMEVLAEAESALGIPELCDRLGLHRSIVYRLLRTLEEHGLVVRDKGGSVRLGPGLAALARTVERDLQASVLPELTALANQLGFTAFLAVLDDDAVVTLVSVEPRHGKASVAQRPGTRHSLNVGGPGAAIRWLLASEELRSRGLERPQLRSTDAGILYAVSNAEVIPGVSSVAVPLVLPDHPPAALAVVRVGPSEDPGQAAALLATAARAVEADLS